MYAQPQTYPRPDQVASPLRQEDLPFFSGVAVFLLGAATGYPVQIVGRIYPGELVLALIALWAFIGLFAMPKPLRSQALTLLAAMVIGLIGYVLSDLYRETEMTDYVRGWSRWMFMILNFLALLRISYRQPKYLFVFMLGFSLVNGTLPLVTGIGRGFLDTWKFYMSVPFVICCLYAMYWLSWRPVVIATVLVFIGALNAALDTRAVALMCLLAAGLVVLAARTKKEVSLQTSLRKTAVVSAAILLGGCVIGAVFIVQKYAEVHNLSDRQSRSTVRRQAMARSTLEIIRDSPFIGYGSWARNPELAKKQERMMSKLKAVDTRGERREDIIIAHSQVLQTWVEGGMMGVFFCAVLGFKLGFSIVNLGLKYPYQPLVPFYAFMLWHCSWHLMFSPFKGTQRLFIAVASVIVAQIAYELALLSSASSARAWFQNYWYQAMAAHPSYGQIDAR